MRKSTIGRGLEAAGLALDMKRLMRAEDAAAKERARHMLAARLGRMRGLPRKLGQSLSLTADPTDAEAFDPLTDSVAPMALAVVVDQLTRAWGRPPSELLADLDPEGHAASLGQVHQARLHDGRTVAVKVAYPGIREAVTADLRLLGWLGKAGGDRLPAGLDLEAYRRVILNDLDEELDYEGEARRQTAYAAKAAPDRGILVPEVVPELCGPGVLVTRWEEGLTLEEAAAWPEPARADLGRLLAHHFLRMFFNEGWIHADPHRGNYRFRLGSRGPEVVLYDYGSVATFPPRTRLLLLRLILMTRYGEGDPYSVLLALGFQETSAEALRPLLPALCKLLLEPLITRGQYDHQGWDRARRIDALLGDLRWNFRMSGPPDLVFLVRGFQGVFYYLSRLGVRVDWHQAIDSLLPEHLAEAMALRLPATTPDRGFAGLARHLRIRITEGGKQKVALTFPAEAVSRLEALMGEELAARVTARGICLEKVARRAAAGGFAPMDLFALEEGDRSLQVWLA